MINPTPLNPKDDLAKTAEMLCLYALEQGLVLEIERVPRTPLAMGNHVALVRVWDANPKWNPKP